MTGADKNVIISTRGLTTGYVAGGRCVEITRELDAELECGRLVCLLGPNGAGKSTLLRTLAGFQPPLGGKIYIDGKDLKTYKHGELARLLSVVLTDKPILDNMDVEALIGLGRTPYTNFWGRMTLKDREVVDEAIKLTGIDTLRNRGVMTLSDGERQKVMIAKALAQETPIIFLDEPTAFLDYPSKVEIMMLLRKLAGSRGKTIFLSTHDLEIALQLADEIWLIDKRLGVAIGTHDELTQSGKLKQYFERPGIHFDERDGLFKIDM